MLDLGEDDWIQDLADIDFWSPATPRGLGQDVVDVLFKGLTSAETCEVTPAAQRAGLFSDICVILGCF